MTNSGEMKEFREANNSGDSAPVQVAPDRRVIAVDLDDVLAQTNQAVANCESLVHLSLTTYH